MILFVTRKKRQRLLEESLRGMVKWADERLDAGDIDLDDRIFTSKCAAQVLLWKWFDDEEEA